MIDPIDEGVQVGGGSNLGKGLPILPQDTVAIRVSARPRLAEDAVNVQPVAYSW